MLSRRGFVNALVGLGFLAFARRAGAAPLPLPRTPRRVRIDGRLSRAVFAALEDEPFRVSLSGRVVVLTLTEIVDGPIASESEQFTVVFRGSRDLVLPEGLYTVRHVTAGSARLFLQPAPDDDHFSYCQASFNLMR
jgi:hypothetical protein